MTKRWVFAAIALFAVGVALAQQAAEPDGAARSSQAHGRGMVRVEGGTFIRRTRSVTVSSFYMDTHLVTQREWTELMGTTARQQRDRFEPWTDMSREGDNYPMYFVNWFEAAEFANRRSARSGLTPAYAISGTNVRWNRGASGYRLPTEAEWEFAARGGTVCRGYFWYSGSHAAEDVAWHVGNSGRSAQPVGMLRPNALGIYDMSGNVWEWVWDWHGPLEREPQTDPAGAPSGSYRVLRGGSWLDASTLARSSRRSGSDPSFHWLVVGFRLVRPCVER